MWGGLWELVERLLVETSTEEVDMVSGTQYEDSSSTMDDEGVIILLDDDELVGTAVISAKLVK